VAGVLAQTEQLRGLLMVAEGEQRAGALAGSTATLVGFIAILLWSLLALLTAASGRVPPFQLAAMTFAIGGALGAATWPFRKGALAALRQPPEVWALGIFGLFGYHALYFFALRLAPPAESGLINYLWPLLIVLFSAFLPGEKLRWYHVAGALLGLVGTVILIAGRAELGFAPEFIPGYCAAFVAAFVWAIYSVLSRRFSAVPTDAVTGFCLVTALLGAIFHLALEDTVWPASNLEWLAVLGLGLGPVGAAFYAWDFGVKRGEIRVLGAASYAAPVLSTIFLVLAGFAEPRLSLALAAALIAAGGLLAAKDMIFRSR
jgi:drug/metabolite transporter (DMT)-like permease